MTRFAQLAPDGHRAAKIDFWIAPKTLYLKVAGKTTLVSFQYTPRFITKPEQMNQFVNKFHTKSEELKTGGEDGRI